MIFHRLLMSAGVPFKPEIIHPDDEFDGYLFEFEKIQASRFEDSGGFGMHWYSEWQVALDEEFNDIIHYSGRDFENLESIKVADTNMEMLSEYYVRVRYVTPTEVSEWSNPAFARTGLFESEVNNWANSILESLSLGF